MVGHDPLEPGTVPPGDTDIPPARPGDSGQGGTSVQVLEEPRHRQGSMEEEIDDKSRTWISSEGRPALAKEAHI